MGISALIGIYIFLLGDQGNIEDQILITALSLSVFSLLGLCSSLAYDKSTLLSLVGMILAIAAFILSINVIWELFELSHRFAEFFLIVFIMTFSAAHVSLLLLLNIKDKMVKAALYATFGFILIVASMLSVVVLFRYENDFYFRLIGVFAILDVLGSIVTPLLNGIKNKA